MFRRGYDLREATISACRQAGFEPRFAVEGGEMDAVLRFVEAGLGIALVPSMVLDGRPGLTGTPLAPPGLRRTIAIAHRKDVEPTRAAQAFRATLLFFLAEAARDGSLPQGLDLITDLDPYGSASSGHLVLIRDGIPPASRTAVLTRTAHPIGTPSCRSLSGATVTFPTDDGVPSERPGSSERPKVRRPPREIRRLINTL